MATSNRSSTPEGSPDGSPDSYTTLADRGEAETKVQRSRFLALVAPATDEQQARAAIAEMESRHHDCRHVCYGWRLGHGAELREIRSDAGEPSGSAGEPILGALRHAGVTDAVAVVARYFGGVKLGTGGLGRAYRDAAAEALANAPTRIIRLGRRGELAFPYSMQKTIRHLLERREGRIDEESYGEQVRWRVWLPLAAWDGFEAEVREASAGQTKPRALD